MEQFFEKLGNRNPKNGLHPGFSPDRVSKELQNYTI